MGNWEFGRHSKKCGFRESFWNFLFWVFLKCFSSVNTQCVCTYTAINLPYSVSKLIGKYNKLKSPMTDENTLFYSSVTVV